MPRPRIEGFDEKLIAGFIERGLYKSQKDVISAAIRLLAEHHMELEAVNAATYTDDTYAQQLENKETPNAAVGNLARQTAVR
jgi:Arc/MetJ-type ribon-helix-helix transcriptional regulator